MGRICEECQDFPSNINHRELNAHETYLVDSGARAEKDATSKRTAKWKARLQKPRQPPSEC